MSENKDGTDKTKTELDNVKNDDKTEKAKGFITSVILNNYDKMDTNNKAVAKVILEKGPDAGRDFMMSSAGFDYSRMRSMYG